MISDQRTSHRVSFFMGADIFKSPAGEKMGRAVIRDLSISGARVETLETMEIGDTVYLDFEVAGKFNFDKIPCLVTRIYRHSGSFLGGLSFERGEDRRRVRQALAYAIETSGL